VHATRYDPEVLDSKVILALVRRPTLLVEAVRAAVSMRRYPFLPIPDRAYTEWRVLTAYGSSDAEVPARDVVAYLEWRRARRGG